MASRTSIILWASTLLLRLGVCGGRPTIKYHRLDAMHIIGFLERGESPKQIARNYRIPVAAVHEAVELSSLYDYEESYA
jgi:uncharacterized protein (DUF433 family)